MNIPNQCPQCGTTLPADAPEQLCPACLMSGGFPTEPDAGATLKVAAPKRRELPQVGETFGAYRIERELGRGGMGAVYAAEQLESGRRVALKVLSHQLDSPDARARFLREGRLAASINHPNSVYVFGTEEVGGTPVITMELIAGGTLQDRIQRGGPMAVGVAVDAALQIIAGLEAAQAIGILHRDIKPANCFEDLDGTVKVGDFGLSISTAARGESHLTLPGDFLGTPAFCSPEQLRGEELNVRSDMYAVGVTLFYLLTGRTPFEGKNMVQLLANALEKAAPSPSQFRPEIPASLSHIVLRCLHKQATERFGSYDELRRALLPFGSTAPTPATLGLRFVAEIADHFVIFGMNMLIPMIFIHDVMDFMNPTTFRTTQWLWLSLGLFAVQNLYFGIFEGRWGASIGKMITGLRVAQLNRSAPGIPRALARALLLTWPTLLNLLAYIFDPNADDNKVWSWGIMGFQMLFVLGMFCTVRRRNGFAAVHDLLTGTRVILKSAYQPRAIIAPTETPVTTTEAMPKLGPYHLLSTLSTGDAETFSLGYDTRLLRRVWIRQTQAGEPAVPQSQRNIARPGRLRWLQGERQANASWDAYEAVNGAPLTSLLSTRQPWQTVRHWLHDLASELEASARDNAVPAVLALDRVWITADGRAKLLDFAAPQSKERELTNVTPYQEPRIFLNQVAMSALEGRSASMEDATSRTVSAPLALGARAWLRDLITPTPDRSFTAKLKPLLQESSCVAWWKRLAMVLVAVVPASLICALMVMGAQMYQRFQTDQPEFTPLMGCLITYQGFVDGKRPFKGEAISGPEAKAALEVHIAGRYGHIIRNQKLWSSSFYKAAIQPEARDAAERIAAAHPHPTAEEMKQADALVKPLVGLLEDPKALKQQMPNIQQMMALVSTLMLSWLLTTIGVVSIVCALVFRGGPLFRILGIAVVTNDGTEASRLRLLGRGLIAWSPVFIGAVVVKYFQSFRVDVHSSLMPSMLLAACLLVITIVSLVRKERGLQDLLAGTWLVPR